MAMPTTIKECWETYRHKFNKVTDPYTLDVLERTFHVGVASCLALLLDEPGKPPKSDQQIAAVIDEMGEYSARKLGESSLGSQILSLLNRDGKPS